MKEDNDKSKLPSTNNPDEHNLKSEEEIVAPFVTSSIELAAKKSPNNEKELKIKNKVEMSDSNSELKLQINDKDKKIYQLKSINDKLREQLKELNTVLDSKIEQAKMKSLKIKSKVVHEESVKTYIKENENMQKMINNYQKEISALKLKLDTKSGFEKVVELENKLHESENMVLKFQNEVKGLKNIQRNQGKELERIVINADYENKIQKLMDQLAFVRNVNKEQEKKIIMMEQNSKNQQNYLVDLQEKHRKLKENKTSLTGAASDHKIEIEKQASNVDKMKSQLDILKDANESLQLKFKIEHKKLNKKLSELEAENEVLKNKLRESEHVF